MTVFLYLRHDRLIIIGKRKFHHFKPTKHSHFWRIQEKTESESRLYCQWTKTSCSLFRFVVVICLIYRSMQLLFLLLFIVINWNKPISNWCSHFIRSTWQYCSSIATKYLLGSIVYQLPQNIGKLWTEVK